MAKKKTMISYNKIINLIGLQVTVGVTDSVCDVSLSSL